MKKLLAISLLAASFLLAESADAVLVDKRLRKGGFGLKGGLLNQSTYNFSGVQYGSKIALSGGLFFEFPLSRKFMLGLSGDLQNVIFDELEDNEPFLDASIGPKYIILVEDADMAIKPGFALGFGYLGPIGNPPLDPDDINEKDRRISRTSYMTWRVTAEVMFLTQRPFAFLSEIILSGTSLGRNSELDVTTNPLLMLRIGVMY